MIGLGTFWGMLNYTLAGKVMIRRYGFVKVQVVAMLVVLG
jgi:hypothetical protein